MAIPSKNWSIEVIEGMPGCKLHKDDVASVESEHRITKTYCSVYYMNTIQYTPSKG